MIQEGKGRVTSSSHSVCFCCRERCKLVALLFACAVSRREISRDSSKDLILDVRTDVASWWFVCICCEIMPNQLSDFFFILVSKTTTENLHQS